MVQRLSRRLAPYGDWLVGTALFLLTLSVYLSTLAPSVAEMFDDSLEFQLVAARLAIAHPTGYPLFTLLIKAFTFLPSGDVAYRVNFATALFGALAVTGVYAVARQLVRSQLAAAIAALIFAFGETFWSQAVLAEVYTLQTLLTAVMLWLALAWASGDKKVSLLGLAFFYGLMLTHHRLGLLLLPALGLYVLSYDRTFLRKPQLVLRLAVAFLLPLLLYLYIPLRGLTVSSLDGTYQNTVSGFFSWITGSSYNVFLTQNPLNESRDAAFYLDLFLRQFTPIGLALAVIGFAAMLLRVRRGWLSLAVALTLTTIGLGSLGHRVHREWMLLTVGLLANLAFPLVYQVADVQVFFIPCFLFVTLFVAVGLDALANALARAVARTPVRAYAQAPLLFFLLVPFALFQGNLYSVDLAGKWNVHDYGRDVLSQSLPSNSTVIGILGEMTLLRYFQETQGLRPDVQTIAADKEPERLAAVESALKNNRTVFLTRQLPGAEQRYSLSSFGPLVLVSAKPTQTAPAVEHNLNLDFDGVKLVGYDLDLARLIENPFGNDSANWHNENGRQVRVTLYWHVDRKIVTDRLLSLKLLLPDGTLGAQLDRQPVLDSYPTTSWRPGEYIVDTYDLPIFIGAPPGAYRLQATLYEGDSGDVLGQADLAQVTLPPDTFDYSLQALEREHPVHSGFDSLMLLDYSLDSSEPLEPGSSVPLVLTWRRVSSAQGPDLDLVLRNSSNVAMERQSLQAGLANWGGNQYARQELSFKLSPQLVPAGYKLFLEPKNCFLCPLPWNPLSLTLGTIYVAGPNK